MLIRTLVAPLLGAACHVLVAGDGRCVVVDPGGGVTAELVDLLTANDWTPVALLATHGHVDHTWDSAALCERYGVRLHLHVADEHRVHDPFGTLGLLGAQLAALGPDARPGVPPTEPFEAPAGVPTHVVLGGPGGLAVQALHVPGHTEGSTTYLVAGADGGPAALTGDVLFAGTVGRTDLPGGDQAAMAASLRRLAALPPDTVVLPGHGPATTIGDELRVNPYLRR